MNDPKMTSEHGASQSEFKYWAFISYSHQDKKWGDWLHQALETYRVPKGLEGQEVSEYPLPKKIFPVFRDREELPSSADLSEQIHEALRQSRYLIVICSPQSAASIWVNEEIKYFKALGRENRVLAVIVDGEPNAADKKDCQEQECFPPALRYRVGPTGKLTRKRTEPIAADAREGKDGKNNARLKLLAGVLGVNYDALKKREKERKRSLLKIRISLTSILVMIISSLGVYSYFQRGEAARRQIEADHNLGLTFNKKTEMATNEKKWNEVRLYALLALARFAPGGPGPDAAQALGRLWSPASYPIKAATMGHSEGVHSVAFSPDGHTLASASQDKTVRLWDVVSMQPLAVLTGHKNVISIVAFSPDGRTLASASSDKTIHLWDLATRQTLAVLSGHTDEVNSAAFSPDGRTLASASKDKTVRLWDLAPLYDQRSWPERIAEAEWQYHLRLVGLDLKPWDLGDKEKEKR